MSEYFNLNEGLGQSLNQAKRRFPKLPFNFNKKLLVLILVAAIRIPLTALLSQQEQDTRQFASEKDEVKKDESVLQLSNALLTEGRGNKNIDSKGAVKTGAVSA